MSVKVKRERPDQRRHHRVSAPLYVVYNGHRLRAADWSLGGLRIEEFPGEVPLPGSDVPLHLTLPFQGFEVSFDAKAQVVRSDPESGLFAVKFTQLGERERELMSHFIEELVRGSMVDVADTIQRIDVPVTPASLEPTKPNAPLSNLPVRRWPIKAVVMSGIYALLGLFVFGYTALLGYSNFYRMEVSTAVIAAPVETVTAQSDGRLVWKSNKPGDVVKSGEVLVNVIDSQLEREIELADIAINERKAQLVYLKRRQVDELERMKNYNTVESKNLEQAKLDLEGVQAQVNAAEQQYGRIAMLHRKGFSTDSRLEEAEKTLQTLKKLRDSKQVEFKSQVELANTSDGRWHYSGQAMIGDVAQIEAQVRLAEHEVLLTQQKYQTLINHKDRLSVRAPFDGTLLELPHVDRGSVRRGDVIAVVEQRRQRQVTAYLNQDEVLRVGLGDEVLIFVPALNETLKGRVAQVDRTSGFVREQGLAQGPGYRWRGASDRSAKVTITFLDSDKISNQDRYRAGLPVVAIFPQRSTNSFVGSIKQRFSGSL
jgi:multidrug resistance efflux pump